MTPVDTDALTQLLVTAESDIAELGWDQPDLLFALHGGQTPELEYVLQLPGRGSEVLRDLVRTGIRARPDIIGLVFVAGTHCPMDPDDLLALPVSSRSLEGDREGMLERLQHAWSALGARDPHPDQSPPSRAVVGVLRNGTVIVVVRRAGEDAQIMERLPEDVADHEDVTELVMRMLMGSQVPLPRFHMSYPRAIYV